MHFKLIIAFVDDRKTEAVTKAAREAGATGITAISSARGEGIKPHKTFLGLSLEDQRDVLLLMVEEHLARHILETICEAGEFESEPGRGIAIQIDVEDAVGVTHQIDELKSVVEEEI
jgi:nitrogen regulatory protein PII